MLFEWLAATRVVYDEFDDYCSHRFVHFVTERKQLIILNNWDLNKAKWSSLF